MPPGARRVAGGVCRPSGNKPEGVQPPEKRMRPGESADAGFRTEGKILETRTAGELSPPSSRAITGIGAGPAGRTRDADWSSQTPAHLCLWGDLGLGDSTRAVQL